MSEEESGKEEHDEKKGEGIIEFVWWNPEPKKVFFSGVIRTVGNGINNNSNKEY